MSIDLTQLKALLAAASPGPWRVETYGSGQANVVFPRGREMAWPPFATIYGNAGIAATLADGTIVGETGSALDGLSEAEYNDQRLSDAMFVAAIRNAAPDLIAEVERLRGALSRLAYAEGRGPITGCWDEPHAAEVARAALGDAK